MAGIEELQKNIIEFNEKLNTNKTLGETSGQYPIVNPIKLSMFTATTTIDQVNIPETLNNQTNRSFILPADQEEANRKFSEEFSRRFKPDIRKTNINGQTNFEINVSIFFVFDFIFLL